MSKWDKYRNCIQIYIQILYVYLIRTEISCRYLIFGIGYISIFMRGASHTPHLITKHQPTSKLPCPCCGNKTKRQLSLISHKPNKHKPGAGTELPVTW